MDEANFLSVYAYISIINSGHSDSFISDIFLYAKKRFKWRQIRLKHIIRIDSDGADKGPIVFPYTVHIPAKSNIFLLLNGTTFKHLLRFENDKTNNFIFKEDGKKSSLYLTYSTEKAMAFTLEANPSERGPARVRRPAPWPGGIGPAVSGNRSRCWRRAPTPLRRRRRRGFRSGSASSRPACRRRSRRRNQGWR